MEDGELYDLFAVVVNGKLYSIDEDFPEGYLPQHCQRRLLEEMPVLGPTDRIKVYFGTLSIPRLMSIELTGAPFH